MSSRIKSVSALFGETQSPHPISAYCFTGAKKRTTLQILRRLLQLVQSRHLREKGSYHLIDEQVFSAYDTIDPLSAGIKRRELVYRKANICVDSLLFTVRGIEANIARCVYLEMSKAHPCAP